MENYIVINGKRAELTEEQLKKLGIVTEKKNPFERAKKGDEYWTVVHNGDVFSYLEMNDEFDEKYYLIANYCTNKDLMQQRAWHETLSRLLWRYSMEHDGDKIDWNDRNQRKYKIYYDHESRKYNLMDYYVVQYSEATYFHTREIANNAIEDIVKPFIEEHPDFVW